MVTQRCPHYNPQIRDKLCEWHKGILHGKRNFADILKNLQIGRLSWNIGDPNVNIRFLIQE